MQIRCSNCFQEYDDALGLCPNCGYMEGEDFAEAYCLAPGTRISERYIIGETLGLGGFGITYKAWDVQLETVLAIKEYFPSGLVNRTADDPSVFLVASKRAQEFSSGKQRFLDEARNMAKFSSHHNIVNVFNYFEANNTAYIVMEYLDGMTLSQALQMENGPLPIERCVSIAIDICDALESIHREGILHRDVSPDNIMLCKDGTVKLFDFGAARFSVDAAEDSNVTVIVKPGFAPPEQYDKINQQDARTDLYALGATLYYALTGIRPEESTDRKIKDTLQTPKALVPEIPDYINNAIMRAMAVEPQFRFENADEFRKVLQQKIKVASIAVERKKRRRRRLIGICAAFLVIAAAGAMLWMRWKQQAEASVLPDGSIELWYVTTGDEAADKAAAASWQAVTGTFMQEYTNVTVTAVGVPGDVYVEKLAEAQKSGTMPDIFESTALPASLLYDAQSLTTLLSDSKNSMYLEGLGGQDTQYPSGLILPAIYVNTSIGPVREAKDITEMASACADFGSTLLGSQDAAGLYESLYGSDLSAYVSDDALDQFLSGNCLMYLGTTADYLAVQDGLMRKDVGTYAVLFPETGTSAYSYGCLWSCSEKDADSTKIAFALLAYLNSDLGQDYFNIRNFAYSGCVPVTKTAMENYTESYVELKGISEFLELPYAK